MSHGAFRQVRAAIAVALVYGAAHGADDKPASVAPVSPPAEDSIAVAKREFDSIKSGREAELGQKGGLPRMSFPDLPSTPGGPAPLAPTKPVGMEKKSPNWLLDAMEKKPDSRKDRGSGKDERDSLRESRNPEFAAERGRSDEADRRVEQDRKAATGATNPLARYLGDWMTSKDYALLKPGLDKSLVVGSDAQRSLNATPFGPPVATSVPVNEIAFGVLQPTSPTVARVAPRQNPYLQSLKSIGTTPITSLTPVVVLPLSVLAASVAPNASSSATPSPLISPPPLPPAQSKIPEFAKPSTDEKYFKQLKRF